MGQIRSEYSDYDKFENRDGSIHYIHKLNNKIFIKEDLDRKFNKTNVEKDCSSCKNGDKEFPDLAVWKIKKAPMECRKIHGIYLCEDHMVVVDADWENVEVEKI